METSALVGEHAKSFEGIVSLPLTENATNGDYLTIGSARQATDTRDVQLTAIPNDARLNSVLFVLRPVPPDTHLPGVRMPIGGGGHVGIDSLPHRSKGLMLDVNTAVGLGRISAILNDGDPTTGKSSDMVGMRFDASKIYGDSPLTEVDRFRFVMRLADTLANCVAKTREQRTSFAFGLKNIIGSKGSGDSSNSQAA